MVSEIVLPSPALPTPALARTQVGYAIPAIVAGAVISVVLTVNNPVGMRHLAIGIGSDQVLMVFFAGMVWLLAAVIGQGQALAEENDAFV